MNSNYIKITLILLALSTANLSWAELSLRVDRTELGADETLELTVTYDDQVSGEPNFAPIHKDFEIFSKSRQQQSSWINGTSTSSTNWKILLIPKRQGKLRIPALSFKGDTSNSIEISVRPADSSAKNTANQPFFIETSTDKDSVYIQEQIILTHRLYYSLPLRDISISEFDIDDALIQQIADNQYQKNINGRNYSVIEIKFALFPQTAGKLNIPAQRISAYEISSGSQFGSFFSRGNQIVRLTQAETVSVMPRPPHIAPNQWMPSSQLRLRETWSDNSANLTVGEPITRTIVIGAQGLTAAQIQPLPVIENNAFRSYPDQPKLEDSKNAQGIIGMRTETIAIVPNQAGPLTLPAIEIEWWDTANNRMQTSRLPARSFNVVASQTTPQISLGDNAGDSHTPTETHAVNTENKIPQPSALTRWSLILNALLIAALVAVLYRRQALARPRKTQMTAPISGAKQQLKQIEKLASENNHGAMRDSILQWGTEVFPQQPPRSLKQLASMLENEDLQQQFAALDQRLFKADTTETTALDTGAILKQLKAYRPTRHSGKDRGTELKPLYPD